jgi:hypothetical protein
MKNRSQAEFVVLMAALMSIVALSIDAVLPALPNIGEYLNFTDPNDNQKIITMIFLGLGIGQLIFGPLSDSFGRKPIVYMGFIGIYHCIHYLHYNEEFRNDDFRKDSSRYRFSFTSYHVHCHGSAIPTVAIIWQKYYLSLS